jgi:hypothetical protein
MTNKQAHTPSSHFLAPRSSSGDIFTGGLVNGMVDFLGFESTQIHSSVDTGHFTPSSMEELTGMFSTQELSASTSTATLERIVTTVELQSFAEKRFRSSSKRLRLLHPIRLLWMRLA